MRVLSGPFPKRVTLMLWRDNWKRYYNTKGGKGSEYWFYLFHSLREFHVNGTAQQNSLVGLSGRK